MTSYLDLDLLLMIQEPRHPFIFIIMSHDLLPRPWPSPGDTGCWTPIHLCHHVTWPLTSTLTFSWWYRMLDTHSSLSSCHMTSYLNLDLLLVIQEAGHPFIFVIMSHDLLPRPWPSPGDTGGWTPIHLCRHVTWPLTSTLTFSWWYRRLDTHSSLSSCHVISYLDLDLLVIQEARHPFIFVIMSHDLLPRPWPSGDTGGWTPIHLCHHVTWPLTSTLTFWWYRKLDTHSSLSSSQTTSYLDLDLLLVIQEAGHPFIFVIMSHDLLPRPWPSPGDTGCWTPINLHHHVTWPLTSTLTFSWWYRRLDTHSSLSSCHMTSYLDLDLLLMIQEAWHPFVLLVCHHVTWPLTSTLTFSWWYRRLDTHSSSSWVIMSHDLFLFFLDSIPSIRILSLSSIYSSASCSIFFSLSLKKSIYKTTYENRNDLDLSEYWWEHLHIKDYTLNKSSKCYIVYIWRVFQKGFSSDKFYLNFDL